MLGVGQELSPVWNVDVATRGGTGGHSVQWEGTESRPGSFTLPHPKPLQNIRISHHTYSKTFPLWGGKKLFYFSTAGWVFLPETTRKTGDRLQGLTKSKLQVGTFKWVFIKSRGGGCVWSSVERMLPMDYFFDVLYFFWRFLCDPGMFVRPTVTAGCHWEEETNVAAVRGQCTSLRRYFVTASASTGPVSFAVSKLFLLTPPPPHPPSSQCEDSVFYLNTRESRFL